MIYLNNLSANTVTLTCSENATLTGITNFLGHFINDSSKEEKLFILNDKTGETRYNLFTINVTGSTANESLTAGTVNLALGWGKYNIYENKNNSNTNLKLSGTTGKILELGKYYVSGITSNIFNSVEYSGNTSQSYGYNPQTGQYTH